MISPRANIPDQEPLGTPWRFPGMLVLKAENARTQISGPKRKPAGPERKPAGPERKPAGPERGPERKPAPIIGNDPTALVLFNPKAGSVTNADRDKLIEA